MWVGPFDFGIISTILTKVAVMLMSLETRLRPLLKKKLQSTNVKMRESRNYEVTVTSFSVVQKCLNKSWNDMKLC